MWLEDGRNAASSLNVIAGALRRKAGHLDQIGMTPLADYLYVEADGIEQAAAAFDKVLTDKVNEDLRHAQAMEVAQLEVITGVIGNLAKGKK